MSENPYILVRWIDSGMHVDHGWDTLDKYKEDIESMCLTVETVGKLMHETDDALMVGLTHDPTRSAWYGAQIICKSNIIEVVYLSGNG